MNGEFPLCAESRSDVASLRSYFEMLRSYFEMLKGLSSGKKLKRLNLPRRIKEKMKNGVKNEEELAEFVCEIVEKTPKKTKEEIGINVFEWVLVLLFKHTVASKIRRSFEGYGRISGEQKI